MLPVFDGCWLTLFFAPPILPTFDHDSGSSELSYGSVAGGASVIHAGTLEEKDLPSFFANLEKAFSSQQGHQRTPAMIMALVEDAKAARESTFTTGHLPAGGFTDVGLHTSGSRRATAWSLTREVFQVISQAACKMYDWF